MPQVPLGEVAREWGRLGVLGFGGPPAHVALLRDLVVERRGWLDAREFEDANAACGLLPGPASTQLAIYCAQRVAGRRGALVGGLAFIVPGLVLLLALAAATLSGEPPLWLRALGAGAGAAVVAVVLQAGIALGRTSFAAAPDRVRAAAYVVAGALAAALAGALVVVALLLCGVVELAVRRARGAVASCVLPAALALVLGASELPRLTWTALKVGALSYGGGFVIIPLMRGDAHRWMSDSEFLNAVALGQLTPGPVVQTVGAVGYAAAGLGGGVLAAVVAFAPSFLVIGLGGARFEALRASANARAFLDGAGPAAVGAILGAAVPLAAGLRHAWQWAIAVAALAALLAGRAPLLVLLGGALAGAAAALLGASVPGPG